MVQFGGQTAIKLAKSLTDMGVRILGTSSDGLVHQDGVLLNGHVDDLHELLNVPVGVGDLHALAAQHVRGTDQYGVAQLYISKVTGVPIIDLATKVMLGAKLRDLDYGTGIYKETSYYAVKAPAMFLVCLRMSSRCLSSRWRGG